MEHNLQKIKIVTESLLTKHKPGTAKNPRRCHDVWGGQLLRYFLCFLPAPAAKTLWFWFLITCLIVSTWSFCVSIAQTSEIGISTSDPLGIQHDCPTNKRNVAVESSSFSQVVNFRFYLIIYCVRLNDLVPGYSHDPRGPFRFFWRSHQLYWVSGISY